ncbi:MAG: hypothetical protein GXP11_06665 [Gammaproteobacteria bacterium]|nr:hypothetical protein [Gammaproteobacteria bacterium]
MFFSGATHAALIGVQDYGDYFTDTSNGLDWYDVTLTVNRSYDDISTKFDLNEEFAGWRYATAQELAQMVNSTTGIATGVTGAGQNYAGENEQFYELTELLGSTIDSYAQALTGFSYDEIFGLTAPANFDFTYGLLADPFSVGTRFAGQILDNDAAAVNADGFQILNQFREDLPDLMIGSYLVRSTIQQPPQTIQEPGIFALFGLGLIGLLFFTGDKKRAASLRSGKY